MTIGGLAGKTKPGVRDQVASFKMEIIPAGHDFDRRLTALKIR